MGIGGSILVLALGAVLAFAVNWNPGSVDIHIVGWILMAAGALWLIVVLSLHQRRRIVRTTARPVATRDEVVEERPQRDTDYYEP